LGAPQGVEQVLEQEVEQVFEQEQKLVQNPWWRFLAALLIGSAFIGLAIALGILIKRSDDNKSQNNPISSQISSQSKTSKTEPKLASIDKSNPVLSTSLSTSSPKPISNNNSSNLSTNQKEASNNSEKLAIKSSSQVTASGNLNTSINPKNSVSSKNSVSPKNGDRNISPSILPIANPDVEAIVFFPSEESQLTFNEEAKIDNFWTKVQGRRGIIQVSGHADKTGDYDYNLDLSQSRANEVVRLLRDRGLDNNYKITFEALSWLQPSRKNNTAADQAFNRRVVIQFKEQR
jgi:outer membrane protein OmpA-like peptidoglycan-associated protein